jgi:hypothetical protein
MVAFEQLEVQLEAVTLSPNAVQWTNVPLLEKPARFNRLAATRREARQWPSDRRPRFAARRGLSVFS